MSKARILLTKPYGGYLDIKEDTSFPINFSLGDIRDISKKNGSFSRTITIIGDKEANKILGYLYDVNIEQETFNINKLQECLVEQDGIVILDNMYLQLSRVRKVQKSNTNEYDIEYEAELRDSSADFFSKINNLMLTDLDFSEFNHLYNISSITQSFNNTYLEGYKYILPYIGQDVNQYDIKDFTPGMYVRNYWDKIFNSAGYTYTFEEKDDFEIQFDKLFIPYNGDIPKIIEDETKWVIANKNNLPLTYTVVSNIIYPQPTIIIFENEIQDDFSYYNPVLGEYTVPFNLSTNDKILYEFKITYDMQIHNHNSFTVSAIGHDKLPIEYSVRFFAGKTLNTSNSAIGSKIQVPINQVISPGQTITLASSVSDVITVPVSGLSINDVLKTWFNTWENSAKNNLAHQKWSTGGSFFSASNKHITNKAIIKSLEVTIKQDLETIPINSILNMNLFVPKKIKQSEFIKSISMMYNLFIDVDKNNVTNLIIKTRDKYYDDGDIVDWSYKLSKDIEQEIKFLPELTNKKIILTYKQDDDTPNKGYFDNVKEIYGQIEYIFENEYIKGIDKKELIFSPTPNINTSFGANIPILNGSAPKTNIRILLDNGLYNCNNYQIRENINTIHNLKIYPFISHFNSPNYPTFDLNFGICDYYFYNPEKTTNNNLYNLHWRRTFNQIDKGKMLTAYFKLNNIDIQKLKLNNKIRIDNSYWNINKIIDYNANSDELTKVELISIDDELKLPEIKRRNILRPNLINTPIKDVKPIRDEYLNNNNSNTIVKGIYNIISNINYGTVRGNNNIIDANGEIDIIGNNNNIKSSSFVIGSGNTVNDSLENVYILGTNINATQSNTFYTKNINIEGSINGVSISKVIYDLKTIGTYSSNSNITTEVSLVYTNTNIVTLYLPSAVGITGSIYKIKDSGGNAKNNNITISGTLSQLIDNSSSYIIKLNYESISVISDGSKWWII